MIKIDVTDEMWGLIEPFIPPQHRQRTRPGGRAPLCPRRILAGIVFVLVNRIAWRDLDNYQEDCSGETCRKRLLAWRENNTWSIIAGVLRHALPSSIDVEWVRALESSATPEDRARSAPGRRARRRKQSVDLVYAHYLNKIGSARR